MPLIGKPKICFFFVPNYLQIPIYLLCRAKGKYNGLVASVALETERITTQSQAEIFFKGSPDKNMEVETEKDAPLAKKLLILNDQGVVTLETSQTFGYNVSSGESDVEMDKSVPPPVVKKRIHEEIGRSILKQKFAKRIKLTFSKQLTCRSWRRE